jgi:hypothetical protein
MDKTARLACSAILTLLLSLLPARGMADTPVDPHGKPNMCQYCHVDSPDKEGKPLFRLNTVEATCLSCHGDRGSTLEDYLRRMLPHVDMRAKMAAYFAKHPDFSCHSCHNAMCQRNSRKELLFRNPHIQLDTGGKIIERACLFCHTTVPVYAHPSDENVAMRYDLSYLCSVCHAMFSQKKGLGFGRTMTETMIEKKAQFEKEYDVSLPLGPGNKVICASCHNPHQPGVILGKGKSAAVSNKHRLVLQDVWLMCTACHVGTYQE